MQKSCFSFNSRSRILAFVRWPCLCPAILWQWFSVSLILATCINENSPPRKRCPFSLSLFIHLLIALTNPVFCIPWVIMQLCYLFCCLNCSCFGPRELSGEAGSQVPFWGARLSSSTSGAPSVPHPSSTINHCSKEPDSLQWRTELWDEHLSVLCVVCSATSCHCVKAPSADRAADTMYTNSRVHTPVLLYLSVYA